MVSGKFIYILGCSGSGKTKLAENLELFDNTKYSRVLETTTRPPRPNETDGVDYRFISDEDFDRESPLMFETVLFQYSPTKYGALSSYLVRDKWNVVVASIEGLLSGLRNTDKNNSQVVVFNIINDDELEVNREGRDPKSEEKINNAILYNIDLGDNVNYYSMKLSQLKLIRNDKEKLIEYFNSITK